MFCGEMKLINISVRVFICLASGCEYLYCVILKKSKAMFVGVIIVAGSTAYVIYHLRTSSDSLNLANLITPFTFRTNKHD